MSNNLSRNGQKIDFDKSTVGTNGVILKAACLSSAQTEAGLGVGGTDDGLCDYNANGVAKTATGNWSAGMHFAIPAAYRAQIPQSGTLQFEICKADALNAITNNGISGNTFMKMWDGTNTTGMPYLQPDFIAAGATTGYRQETEGYGGLNASGMAVGIVPNSAWANVDNLEYILTSNSVCDVDGTHITFTMTFDPQWCYYNIGGNYVGRHHRKQCVYTPNEILFNQAWGVRIRKLILSTQRLFRVDDTPGIPRVLICSHSFGNHVNGHSEWDATKGYWTEDAAGTGFAQTYGIPEGIQPTIQANLSTPMKLMNVSKSSQNTSWAQTLAQATLNSTDSNRRIDRFRPDFVVFMFRTNEAQSAAGITAMKSAMHNANVALRAKGIPVIWVNEQNGNYSPGTTGGIATYNHSLVPSGASESLYAAFASQVAADKASLDMDMGYCDVFALTGGASVNPIYVENNATADHLNMVAAPIYGASIASEINRLWANLPAYHWRNK